MNPPSKEREKGRCLECGAPFVIERSFTNRNAKIRYCNDCKAVARREQYDDKQGQGGGKPKRISKFSKSGKVSITAD